MGARRHVEAAAHRVDALADADQPEALAPHSFDGESHAVVDNGHGETVGVAAQVYGNGVGMTVLERILQGFLHDSEDAQGELGGRLSGTSSCVKVILGVW